MSKKNTQGIATALYMYFKAKFNGRYAHVAIVCTGMDSVGKENHLLAAAAFLRSV